MRKYLAALLVFALVFSLCACGKGDGSGEERDCGVFITVEASDVYAISCGTSEGSESASNDDESVIAVGSVFHFDFAGEAAEGEDAAIIDYSICAYDENLDIIAEGSFCDDFANMAKYEFVITEDHHILYNGEEYSGGGDILVSYTDTTPLDSVSVMAATVSMSARPEAEEAINTALTGYNDTFCGDQYEANKAAYGKADDGSDATGSLDPFSMSRTVRVMRGDDAVLSFRMADRANLGNSTTLAITCHSFDPQTGNELSIKDIASDKEKFTDFCAEQVLIATTEEERFLTESMIFVDGYTDNIRSLISDGHWYFSSEGLVIAANPGDISTSFYEFVIPYEDLTDVLKSEYMPAEPDGDFGTISVQLTENADLGSRSVLNVGEGEASGNLLLNVTGTVYNVNIYTGTYNSDTGKFSLNRQLCYCSDMMRDASLNINAALAEGSPELSVSFTSPDGAAHNLLISSDSANGGILVMDILGGSDGVIVNGSCSYDINSDGADENIKVVSGDTVSLSVGNETAETEIAKDADVRLYDLNGDGKMEIFISGEKADGENAAYCFTYTGSLTALSEPISGLISEFNGNRVFMLADLNILGDHPVNAAYYYSSAEGKLCPMSGFEYVFDDGEYITVTAEISLKDGTAVPVDTKLNLLSTDGESYVKVSSDDGISGVLEISMDTLGQWNVNGQPASSCIK